MYKAVFIDIDGTLIKKDHSIGEDTFNTIQQLIKKEVFVVLVSARPLCAIKPIAAKINLLHNPMASLNGSYISYNNEIIFNSVIDLNTTRKIYDNVQSSKPTIIYYQQDQWFAETKDLLTDHEQKITAVPLTIQPFNNTLEYWQNNNTGPNKILIIVKETFVQEKQQELKSLYAESVNIDTSKSTYLEVINKSASKKNAVKFLIDRYNIKVEETIAIGDNFNDKQMIEFAGMGIAMGNAPDVVKAAADYVTDTNNNDGIAKALKKIMNL